jgi:hypothetical protein
MTRLGKVKEIPQMGITAVNLLAYTDEIKGYQ